MNLKLIFFIPTTPPVTGNLFWNLGVLVFLESSFAQHLLATSQVQAPRSTTLWRTAQVSREGRIQVIVMRSDRQCTAKCLVLGARWAGSRGSNESREWHLSGASHRRNAENTILPLQWLLGGPSWALGVLGVHGADPCHPYLYSSSPCSGHPPEPSPLSSHTWLLQKHGQKVFQKTETC